MKRAPSLTPAITKRVTKPIATTANLTSLLDTAIRAALILAIFFIYAQTSRYDYVTYDDPEYVADNVHVHAGLAADSVKSAFTAVVSGNWAPLTMLSHMLDSQLFGMDAGPHHLTNVLLHMLASLFLLLALQRATGARWTSAFVAFAFALHPLHVESVAWISERKDVLSAFFFFLALYAYVRYVETPSPRRYLLVALPFALGLLAKSMLITFPFVLLLVDFWPLGRPLTRKLVWEKVPLFLLSAATTVAMFVTQQSIGAVGTSLPLLLRLENALLAYVIYIGQLLWPARLALIYPYPDAIALWQAGLALLLLLGISALAIFTWKSRPYLLTGWLWYLGMLVPVIGLVQVGAQPHADRYTYLPIVGVLIMFAWGAADLVRQRPRLQSAIATLAAVVCCAWIPLAHAQAAYWQNGVTILQHSVDVTDDNKWGRLLLAEAHYLQGTKLMNAGHSAEAIDQFEGALRVRPNYAEAQNNLGIQLVSLPGRAAEALLHFEAAVRIAPGMAQAQRNLGMALAAIPGRAAEAREHLQIAQRLQPDPQILQMLNRLQ